ncbi:hypothetical protein [Sphingobacterium sp. HMA12]|uniref:hypothetical protein n=1 Tax=Sphingobacterium sp. HMA12 TaxID=2050894 RepID=UPI000CEA2F39|nr:hypothetical protein [Sphingobacterium sp. HMA12]
MTPRSRTLLLPLLSIFFWINPASAQNPERTKTIMVPADSAYTKIVQALHESGYYIAKLDRPSGFIQTSVYNKNTGLFSNEGDTKISNFLVSPLSDRTAKIVLNIFLIERRRGGSFDSPNYYDENKGIIRDDKIYQQVWNKILPLLQ